VAPNNTELWHRFPTGANREEPRTSSPHFSPKDQSRDRKGAVGVDSQRSCSRHSIGRVSWSRCSGIVLGRWAMTGSLTVAALIRSGS